MQNAIDNSSKGTLFVCCWIRFKIHWASAFGTIVIGALIEELECCASKVRRCVRVRVVIDGREGLY